jgi:tetratricopeptide (TPR) repeat protein
MKEHYMFFIVTLYLFFTIPVFCINYTNENAQQDEHNEFVAARYFLEGMKYENKNDIKKAIEMYNLALKYSPESIYLRREIAALYSTLGDTTSAVNAIEPIVRTSTDTSLLTFALNLYISCSEEEKSREILKKILSMDKVYKDTELLYSIAKTISSKYKDKAKELLSQVIEMEPNHYEAIFYLANLYISSGEYDKALLLLEKLLSQPLPLSMKYFIHLTRGGIFEVQRNYKEAISEYENALSVAKFDIEMLLKVGILYFQLRQYTKAKQYLQLVTDNPVCSTQAKYFLGCIYEQEKKYDIALKFFLSILKDTKNIKESLQVYLHLANVYGQLNRFDKAIYYLEKVYKEEPQMPDVCFFLGLAYYSKKDYKKAETFFRKAIELNPDFVEAYYYTGIMLDMQKKFSIAEKFFRKTISLDNWHANAMNYLGYSYAERGIKLGEAYNLIQRALEIDPENAAYIDSLGWVYYRMGKYREAYKELKRASFLLYDPIIYEHVGDASYMLKKYDEAYLYWSEIKKPSKQVKCKIRKILKELNVESIAKTKIRIFEGNLKQLLTVKCFMKLISSNNESENLLLSWINPGTVKIESLDEFSFPQSYFLSQDSKIKFYSLEEGKVNLYLTLSDVVKSLFSANILTHVLNEEKINLIHKKNNRYIIEKGKIKYIFDAQTGNIYYYNDSMQKIELIFSQYKSFDGIYLPQQIEARLYGVNQIFKIKVLSLSVNVNIEQDELENISYGGGGE